MDVARPWRPSASSRSAAPNLPRHVTVSRRRRRPRPARGRPARPGREPLPFSASSTSISATDRRGNFVYPPSAFSVRAARSGRARARGPRRACSAGGRGGLSADEVGRHAPAAVRAPHRSDRLGDAAPSLEGALEPDHDVGAPQVAGGALDRRARLQLAPQAAAERRSRARAGPRPSPAARLLPSGGVPPALQLAGCRPSSTSRSQDRATLVASRSQSARPPTGRPRPARLKAESQAASSDRRPSPCPVLLAGSLRAPDGTPSCSTLLLPWATVLL